MPIRIILWKRKRIMVCHTCEVWIFVVQIIGEEKEMFLEHVYCSGLLKKSSSLSRRPEKCDLQLSHCNWIVTSKKLDLVDVTFEILFFKSKQNHEILHTLLIKEPCNLFRNTPLILLLYLELGCTLASVVDLFLFFLFKWLWIWKMNNKQMELKRKKKGFTPFVF